MGKKKNWLIKTPTAHVEGPYTTEEILEKIRNKELLGKEFISLYPGEKWIPITHTPSFYDSLLEALSKDFHQQQKEDEKESGKETSSPSKSIKDFKVKKKENDDPPSFLKSSDTSSKNNEVSKENDTASYEDKEETQTQAKTKIVSEDKTQQEELEEDKTQYEASILQKLDNKKSLSSDFASKVPFEKKEAFPLPSDTIPSPQVELKKPFPLKKAFFFLLIGVGFLLFLASDVLFQLFSSKQPYQTIDSFHLIPPPRAQKNKKASLLKSEVQSKIKRGLSFFIKSNPEFTMKAQTEWIQAMRGNHYHKEILSLLCLSYFDLWPYTSQKSKELNAVLKARVQVSSSNPVSLQSFVCEEVYLTLQNRHKEAKDLINKLENFSSSVAKALEKKFLSFLYYLKALEFEKDNKIETAFKSLYLAKSLWPKWVRLYQTEARLFQKVKNFEQASSLYQEILKFQPQNKQALMSLGFIYIQHRNLLSGGEKLLQQAFQLKGRVSEETLGKAYLAQAVIETQKKKLNEALNNAKKAYFLGQEEAYSLISRIQGQERSRELLGQMKDHIFIQKGHQQMRKKQFHEALILYEKAYLQKGAHRGKAAFKAALCLWNMNLHKEAVKWLERTLKHDPHHTRAYVFLSKYYGQLYDYNTAEKLLLKAYKLIPGDYRVFRAYGFLEKKRKRFKSAIQYSEKALSIFEMDLKTYHLLVNSLIETGQSEKAYRYAARALEINPYFSFVHVMYAEALYSLYGIEAGVKYLEELLKENPSQVEFLFTLGQLMEESGDFRRAQTYFFKTLNVNPKFKKAYVEMGRMFKKNQNSKEALDLFFKALSLDPLDADILYDIAFVYKEMKDFSQAERYFERVLEVNSKYPLIHYVMGEIALEQKNVKKALKYAQKEKKLNPDFSLSYTLMAESYRKMNQYNFCFDAYQKAVSRGLQDSNVYIKMAECSRLSGGIDAALSLLNQARHLESGNPLVYKELGVLYETKGEWNRALKSYETYLTLAPQAQDRHLIQKKISKIK